MIDREVADAAMGVGCMERRVDRGRVEGVWRDLCMLAETPTLKGAVVRSKGFILNV